MTHRLPTLENSILLFLMWNSFHTISRAAINDQSLSNLGATVIQPLSCRTFLCQVIPYPYRNPSSLAGPCNGLRCEHGGLLSVSECRCSCPYAFGGERCETLKRHGHYNDASCGVIEAQVRWSGPINKSVYALHLSLGIVRVLYRKKSSGEIETVAVLCDTYWLCAHRDETDTIFPIDNRHIP